MARSPPPAKCKQRAKRSCHRALKLPGIEGADAVPFAEVSTLGAEMAWLGGPSGVLEHGMSARGVPREPGRP